MKFLDSLPQVKTWTKLHKIRIHYKLHKRRKRYTPDILVEYVDGRKVLEEVKGFVYDRRKFMQKNGAALLYCMRRGIIFRILYEEDLETVT